jgi:hypothetical protein
MHIVHFIGPHRTEVDSSNQLHAICPVCTEFHAGAVYPLEMHIVHFIKPRLANFASNF